MGDDPGEGRDHDRRQVRRAAVRVQEPAERARSRASTSTSARRSPTSSASSRSSSRRSPTTGSRSWRTGTVDLILSTMTINAERDQEIDFSEPYYIAHGRILVPQDSDITGVDDLAGKKRLHGARLDLRGDAQGAGAGRRPAARRLLLGVPGAAAERRRRRGLDRRRDPHRHDHPGRHAQARRRRALTTEPYGAGIKDGDTEFKDFVDGVLDEYKRTARWDETYEKWVGQYTDEQQDAADDDAPGGDQGEPRSRHERPHQRRLLTEQLRRVRSRGSGSPCASW